MNNDIMTIIFENDLMIQTIQDFNETLLSLALNFAQVCPKSIIGSNIDIIEKIIKNINKNKKNFTKFIDVFCIKVLKYKNQIDSGDDEFFMNKSYDDDLKDQNESYLNYVLSIKTVWNQLSRENKEIVKQYMQILCTLAQEYFDFIDHHGAFDNN
jgi:hypothetical protein